MKFDPFTDEELLETFRGSSMSAKHVLLIYSFIVGLNAQVVLDMGVGNSTRVARAAVRETGGVVYSCDIDRERFAQYEQEGSPEWRFYARPSAEVLRLIPTPIDFVFHDASHEHAIVRQDLLTIIPMMRRYGLICVHDTQQPRYTLLEAIDEVVALSDHRVSLVTLPYGCGLTILRVESSSHEEISPAGRYRGDRVVTVPRTLAQTSP